MSKVIGYFFLIVAVTMIGVIGYLGTSNIEPDQEIMTKTITLKELSSLDSAP